MNSQDIDLEPVVGFLLFAHRACCMRNAVKLLTQQSDSQSVSSQVHVATRRCSRELLDVNMRMARPFVRGGPSKTGEMDSPAYHEWSLGLPLFPGVGFSLTI